MRKYYPFRPIAYLPIAALLIVLAAPTAQAVQPVQTEQEAEQQNVASQKQGFFAYFLSLFSVFDRNSSAEPSNKRRSTDFSTVIAEEPLPDPEPQTTESGEDDPDNRGQLDPNG